MIEVRTKGGQWVVIDPDKAREFLKRSGFVYYYDQIETPADRFLVLDFAIPAFLGAPPRFSRLREQLALSSDPTRLQKTLESLGQHLAAIPVGVDLWELADSSLVAIENLYREVCQLKGFADATTSKMLHRKRPQAIPVIDSRIVAAWPTESSGGARRMGDITRAMSEELGQRSKGREELSAIAKALGEPFSSLTDLRLYDVISYQLSEASTG